MDWTRVLTHVHLAIDAVMLTICVIQLIAQIRKKPQFRHYYISNFIGAVLVSQMINYIIYHLIILALCEY